MKTRLSSKYRMVRFWLGINDDHKAAVALANEQLRFDAAYNGYALVGEPLLEIRKSYESIGFEGYLYSSEVFVGKARAMRAYKRGQTLGYENKLATPVNMEDIKAL